MFDFIIEVYRHCKHAYSSQWADLARASEVTETEMLSFLEYAASFLSNVGLLCKNFSARIWAFLNMIKGLGD